MDEAEEGLTAGAAAERSSLATAEAAAAVAAGESEGKAAEDPLTRAGDAVGIAPSLLSGAPTSAPAPSP